MKKKIVSMMLYASVLVLMTSCFCSSSNDDERYDENYWNSVSRERALREAGYEGAANMERNNRLNYMQGGGYTSPNGGRQVNYKGSKEQKRDLELIDSYDW